MFGSAALRCGKAQQWISSISLVAEMESKDGADALGTAWGPSRRSQEIQPDEVTWNCLLSALEILSSNGTAEYFFTFFGFRKGWEVACKSSEKKIEELVC